MSITACVLTLGCRVNQYESDAIIKELSKNGVTIKNSNEICDIYIINTCSVTAESDRKSRQLIRRCAQKNKDAVIIVTGCYSQINPEEAVKIEGVSYVFGNNAKSQIAKKALLLHKERTEPGMYVPSIYDKKFDVLRVGAPMSRTRAFIKIQDGCDSKCAYCIIPFARGSVRSNSAENIISEVKSIVEEGCQEVVLTGIETAAYGKDFENGYSLADLLTEINEIEGVERIRLGSLDPSAITREFVDKIKGLSKVMNHFHISMQNGSTKILNLMKRKYNIDMARDNIHYLKKSIPGVMLSADIITGFPCEDEEDFNKTYEFFKEEKFLHLHIFPYSKRKGTVAEAMKCQVPENIKKERLHRLEELEREIKSEILQSFIDRKECLEVLFETYDGEFNEGHSREFIQVRAKSQCSLNNKIVKIMPTHHENGILYGDIV